MVYESLYPVVLPSGDPVGDDWLWYHPGLSRANGFLASGMMLCKPCDVMYLPAIGAQKPHRCWNCGKFVAKRKW